MATMDGTIAIVALPKIQNELGLTDAGRSWVITAYVLTFGGLMLLGGRLGDTIGRKRTFIVGVALFTIASALCGIAWDDPPWCIARLLQGVGAAIALADRLGADRHHLRQGSGPQRRHRGVRRDDRRRLGDGPGGRRSADRDVLAAGVPGQRADRAGDDLPGAHRAAGNPPRADEARRRRRCAGDTGLHRRGVRLLDRDPRRAGSRSPPSARVGGLVAFIAFAIVERTAENPVVPFDLFFDRNRLATFVGDLHGRRGAVHRDGADRPLRAGHHGLQRAARRCRLHPVRDRDGHRPGRFLAAGVAVPAAGRGHRRRSAGGGRDDLRVDARRAACRTSRTWSCRSSSAVSVSA